MVDYTIKKGDTLSTIAKKFYGKANLYSVIAKYNKIKNPDRINVGQVIKIPDRLYNRGTSSFAGSTPVISVTPLPATPHATSSLNVELSSIQFLNSARACLGGTQVASPHWRSNQNCNDGAGSLFPVVYRINESVTVDLTIAVHEPASSGATLRVSGTINGFTFQGNCTNAAGNQIAHGNLTNVPRSVNWIRGDVLWRISSEDGSAVAEVSTRIELFFILETPVDIYNASGVWIEALRALCGAPGIIGSTDKRAAVAGVTTFCHTFSGFSYDVMRGRSHYDVSPLGSSSFDFRQYLMDLNNHAGVVNCYDQAAGVQVLCGALGIDLVFVFVDPFGYINITNLVGVGLCNNPFYARNGANPIVSPTDSNRTAFGNHAFVAYNTAGGAGVSPPPRMPGFVMFDACAGPHLGIESFDVYIHVAIDMMAFPNENYQRNEQVSDGVVRIV